MISTKPPFPLSVTSSQGQTSFFPFCNYLSMPEFWNPNDFQERNQRETLWTPNFFLNWICWLRWTGLATLFLLESLNDEALSMHSVQCKLKRARLPLTKFIPRANPISIISKLSCLEYPLCFRDWKISSLCGSFWQAKWEPFFDRLCWWSLASTNTNSGLKTLGPLRDDIKAKVREKSMIPNFVQKARQIGTRWLAVGSLF